MLKPIVIALMVATLTLSQTLGAVASTLSISNWQASGSQMWRITFPGDTSGLADSQQANSGASELYYPHSGNYATINYEYELSPNRKLTIEAGILGTLTPATGSDSDWDYSKSQDLWYYGVFQTNGSSTFINIDVKQATSPNTEFFYGYGYSNSQYSMTNGYYSIMNYVETTTSLPNLNSTYSMVYHGPHVGFSGTKQLAPKLALVGSISYSPLALAQGQGWWNLRNLDFEHLGSGQMLDGKIGLRYLVAGRHDNALTLGYRYQQHRLYTGSEDTSSAITWTDATKIQQGWYMGGDFKF
ncbi:hypothetical protein [Sporomusa malonica]|uniref:Uncharacterized protein n=1 Tax=Sporomusa malonica TaxID=112901 RepID=A0A1W2CBZ0_9FIRM|nr:hypothetical protein [Sporomusa malonica]SMC82596.1 hypothetical protein SAMN04488500_11067 [Sporomusa malonica]